MTSMEYSINRSNLLCSSYDSMRKLDFLEKEWKQNSRGKTDKNCFKSPAKNLTSSNSFITISYPPHKVISWPDKTVLAYLRGVKMDCLIINLLCTVQNTWLTRCTDIVKYEENREYKYRCRTENRSQFIVDAQTSRVQVCCATMKYQFVKIVTQ